jgi:PIN domain nuclease of toxin-antitoxin system
MAILLDTHIFLHMIGDAERLSSEQRAAIDEPRNNLFFSLASVWEIAIKYRLGKLKLPFPPSALFPSQLQHFRIELLPITLAHVLHVEELPIHHHDPFDRLIIAQARILNMPLMSSDQHFSSYNIQLIR